MCVCVCVVPILIAFRDYIVHTMPPIVSDPPKDISAVCNEEILRPESKDADQAENAESEEIVFECKQIKASEKSANAFSKLTTLNNNLGLTQSNDFPSIDKSEPVKNGETAIAASQSNLNSAKAPREWKREKTFDGCPIYFVKKNKSLVFGETNSDICVIFSLIFN